MRTASLTIKQVLILMGIVVAVVFAVTYASMMTGGGGGPTKAPTPSPPQQSSLPPLTLLSVTPWPSMSPEHLEESVRVFEWQAPGHHEFWFRNDHDVPVQVWLENKTCTCTEVDLCLLPDDMKGLETKDLDARAADPKEDPKLEWKPLRLNDQKTAVTVPAHGAGGARMAWKNKERKNGGQSMKATLGTESPSALGGSIDLELHLAFVDPVMVSPEDNLKEPTGEEQVPLGDPVLAGDARTVNLACWSATRDDFTVQPEPTNDPCVSVGTPEKLSAEECKQLPLRNHVPVTVLCAYRVPVTVRERTEDGKHQLDLGRFRRRLQFTSKVSPEPVAITLVGLVRGDIEVGMGAEKDVVALGSFKRDVGTSKDVQLKTDRGDIDLEVVSQSLPDFLKAELREEKDVGGLGKVWTLTVTVPPNAFSGDIPRHTYIVLKTKGERPRRLHIPVTGIAYVP